jgi:hypothetical protein
MKTLPSEIPVRLRNQDKWKAERRVFEAMKETRFGEGATAVHSLRLAEHQYKREGELDFVVVSPFGLFVLEVKGGGVRRDESGMWIYTDRYGNDHRNAEGPFGQAQSGMYSLVTSICDHFGEEIRHKLVYGFGVITPDARLPEATPEWDSRQVLDKTKFDQDAHLQGFLGGLRNYYDERYASSKRDCGRIPSEVINDIVGFLRPAFDRVPSLVHRVGDVREVLHSLTEEQYRYLDFDDANKRILCEGGAGTGKTFLAMEVARRENARGRRTLLTCRSPSLSQYLESRMKSEENVDVLNASTVCSLDDDVEYETLIVDEGQDVLTADILLELVAHLRGGVDDGRWRFFYDPNRQSGFYGEAEQEALQWLENARPVKMPLSQNCRNPLPVVQKTQIYTGGDLGDPGVGEGPKVEIDYAKDRTDSTGRLRMVLRKLMREGLDPGSVAVLSPLDFEDSSVSTLPRDLRSCIRPLDPETASEFPFSGVAFSSIRDFKGFESDAVIVTDLDETRAVPSIQNVLYVAMSRARFQLFLILPKSMRSTMERLANKHLSDISEA